MYKVLERQDLAPVIHLFKIHAPEVARKARAGQFVIVKIDEKGERIPLTFADWDEKAGNVTIIFMEAGATTCRLARMEAGESLTNFTGPLGVPTHIENFGTVVCVGGGIGVAPITPIAAALKKAGNHVISIMGSRNKSLLFWEDKLRQASNELIVTTDDGSYGRKALVTEPLKEQLSSRKIDRVIAIGPIPMMKFCSLTSQPFGVKTIVSLNPLMVDGTGMCGCCRVSIGGSTKFACVDGPDFDGHQVDWDLMAVRSKGYAEEEKRALEQWQCRCKDQ
ncbi:MAG: sulfide/dihydroorotate dehydrogenase-like FAD/NAD-binding protein [Dehalococcoidales bacterium]|nr:sulfide/dihydroorotate dehydrogenase-like FAD/NAD-binding protein [Dehalococcoidales bacterium]